MSAPSEVVALAHDGAISVATIQRPEAMNALNAAVIERLLAIIEECRERGTRVLILTGSGKAFVAGADIAAMANFNEAQAAEFSLLGHSLGSAMEGSPFAIIAAVNGFALGGGCELMLACDFAYAATSAKFGQPEVKLGVIPGFGGTQRLTRAIGRARARELVYTGKMISAEEALQIGLINALVAPESLMEKVREVAEMIVKAGPIAVQKSKSIILQGADLPLPDANALEARGFAECFNTRDQSEGMAAFLEKRTANFEGK